MERNNRVEAIPEAPPAVELSEEGLFLNNQPDAESSRIGTLDPVVLNKAFDGLTDAVEGVLQQGTKPGVSGINQAALDKALGEIADQVQDDLQQRNLGAIPKPLGVGLSEGKKRRYSQYDNPIAPSDSYQFALDPFILRSYQDQFVGLPQGQPTQRPTEVERRQQQKALQEEQLRLLKQQEQNQKDQQRNQLQQAQPEPPGLNQEQSAGELGGVNNQDEEGAAGREEPENPKGNDLQGSKNQTKDLDKDLVRDLVKIRGYLRNRINQVNVIQVGI